jgi:hypothetical protein
VYEELPLGQVHCYRTSWDVAACTAQDERPARNLDSAGCVGEQLAEFTKRLGLPAREGVLPSSSAGSIRDAAALCEAVPSGGLGPAKATTRTGGLGVNHNTRCPPR